MSRKQAIWILSAAISIGLLALLLWLVEPGPLLSAFEQVQWWWLLLCLIPLTAEALITSFRIQRCANRPVTYATAVYCNAWYVLWLSVLPARLGEVAAVGLFRKILQMRMGDAIASIIVQRIYDVMILCGLLLLLLGQTMRNDQLALGATVAVLLLLSAGLTTLPFWLRKIAALLFHYRHQHRLFKQLLRMTLQAKSWHQQHRGQKATLLLTTTTLAKWIVNLITVVLVFYACGLSLELTELLVIAILIHFLGAIPIQSVGGFGVVEVGLTGILVSFGVEPAMALATSLVLRVVGLSYNGLYFTVALITFKTGRKFGR